MKKDLKSRLTALFEVIPNLMMLIDDSGKVIEFQGRDMGHPLSTKETYLNKNVFDALPKEVSQTVHSSWKEAQSTFQVVQFRISFYLDRKLYHLDCRIKFFPDSEESLFLTTNVTGQVEAEKGLLEERKNLSQRIREQITLYEIMSLTSDMNTPLGSILSEVVQRIPDALVHPETNECSIQYQDTFWTSRNFQGINDCIELKRTCDQGSDFVLRIFSTVPGGKSDGFLLAEEHLLLHAIVERLVGFIDQQNAVRTLKERESQQTRISQILSLHNQVLNHITTLESGREGLIHSYADEVVWLVSELTGIERVIIWLYWDDGNQLECLSIHDKTSEISSKGILIEKTFYPNYFSTLEGGRFLAVDDTQSDPRIAELLDSYINPLGIRSSLDCTIVSGGRPLGYLSFEYITQEHTWEHEEITFGTQVADQIAIVILNKSQQDATKALKKNEELLKKAQVVSRTGHWYLQISTNILTFSEETYNIFGFPKDVAREIPTFLKYIHPLDRDQLEAAWGNALAGRPFELTHRIIRGEEIRWVDQKAEIEKNTSGIPEYVLGIVQDVTDRVKSAHLLEQYRLHLEDLVASRTAELEEAKTIAETSSMAKTAFLSNMSHEIRTPMNAILGYAHLINRGPLTDTQKNQLQKLSNSGHHLLQIINDILDLSKIEAHKIELETQEFDLPRMLDKIFELVSKDIEAKGLTFMIRLNTVPRNLIGDGLRVSQILLNLVSNAVKFTEKGGITISGTVVEKHRQKNIIRLEVRDTGIGIPPDIINRLFTPFQQADGSTTRMYGGTGLGLAISKKLTELMGGRIGVQSRVNQGSNFWVEIPFGIHKGTGEKSIGNSVLHGLRVLIIDGERESRTYLESLGRDLGLRTDTVLSETQGLEAVEKAYHEKDSYGLLIINWNGNELGGLKLAKKIRQLYSEDNPILVFIPTSHDSIYPDISEELGFTAILPQPVTISSLNDTLTKLYYKKNRTSTIAPLSKTQRDLNKRAGSKILLVEDNLINQEVSKELLSIVQMDIDIAEHGGIAVEMVKSSSYDLILMDMQMPVMDGIEATKAIRQLPQGRNVPILAMTANAFDDDKSRCLAAGMNGHIPKPVIPEKLYLSLIEWLPEKQQTLVQSEPPLPAIEEQTRLDDDLELLKTIPGFKVEIGLKSLQGNRKTLIRIIHQFIATHKHDRFNLSRLAKKRDFSGIAGLCHSLKGVSGTLGFGDIYQSSSQIEKLAQNNPTDPELIPKIDTLVQLIHKLTETYTRLFPELETPPQKTSIPGKPDQKKFIPQLTGLLSDGDSRAWDFFHDNKSDFELLLGDSYEEIEDLINTYDFPQALKILQQETVQDTQPGVH